MDVTFTPRFEADRWLTELFERHITSRALIATITASSITTAVKLSHSGQMLLKNLRN
ncbi:MAG: hypothetical protein ACOC5A_05980 [Halanaerobiales bacterium]